MDEKFEKINHDETWEKLILEYTHLLADLKDGILSESKLSSKQITIICHHVSNCNFCRRKIRSLLKEYRDIEHFLIKEGVPDIYIHNNNECKIC